MVDSAEGTPVDVAGQLGGKDAQPHFLPHFKALKSACKQSSLRNLPARQLTFILRMDGEISTYGPPGVGPIIIDGDGSISVDLQISIKDRPDLDQVIPRYMLSSMAHLKAKLGIVDSTELDEDIKRFVERYQESLTVGTQPFDKANS